ncbi:MAG: [FeFe] hydrogenase H-cluster maturation GTPase HydF [Lachnospiraceae bacterium]|nr:[FeFe] hydrogenase H-cluster maturation GTPase HydF [Lachnospiraceae bacterium]
MSMNETPASERKHIAFFGCRNAGKSSLVNAITGQNLSIVSDVLGTTTDPVNKTMEILPLGPVVITDTPGLDDVGELGQLRIGKAKDVLRKTDLAILVIDSEKGFSDNDGEIFETIKEKKIPYIIVYNKSDISDNEEDVIDVSKRYEIPSENFSKVSSLNGEGIYELKDKMAAMLNETSDEKVLIGDLVNLGDIVVLVVPIDKAAPKGRLILPQQQTIRDLLDHGAVPIVCRDSELSNVIDRYKEDIKLVVTDSQAFKKVSAIVPEEIPLTSFSIIFSRYKGELAYQLEGVEALKNLKDGDYVLIAEGCTHHRQCGDIGTEKIPAMLKKAGSLNIDFVHGAEYPDDLDKYKVIIHCGGCMLNEKEMKYRIEAAKERGVAITNYGMCIAYFTGVLERSMKPLMSK